MYVPTVVQREPTPSEHREREERLGRLVARWYRRFRKPQGRQR